jgi:hypothetical protein
MTDTTILAAPEPPLTHDQRLRRCMILCCTVARNLAYHRARREGGGLAHRTADFWNTADGNFIDAAVLAWCALFADDNLKRGVLAKQGWRKMLPAADHESLERALLVAMGVDQAAYDELIEIARRYRDKFLAHLDSDRTMLIPHMEAALRGARFLYDRIWSREIDPIWRGDAPQNLKQVYDRALVEGVQTYGV